MQVCNDMRVNILGGTILHCPLKYLSRDGLAFLSQIDRLYDWKRSPETDVVVTLKKQKKNTKDEFDERTKAIIVEFAQQVCGRFLLKVNMKSVLAG